MFVRASPIRSASFCAPNGALKMAEIWCHENRIGSTRSRFDKHRAVKSLRVERGIPTAPAEGESNPIRSASFYATDGAFTAIFQKTLKFHGL